MFSFPLSASFACMYLVPVGLVTLLCKKSSVFSPPQLRKGRKYACTFGKLTGASIVIQPEETLFFPSYEHFSIAPNSLFKMDGHKLF